MKRIVLTDLLEEMDVVADLTGSTLREVAGAYMPGCVLFYWDDVCMYVALDEPCWDEELERAIRDNLTSEGFRLMVVYEQPAAPAAPPVSDAPVATEHPERHRGGRRAGRRARQSTGA